MLLLGGAETDEVCGIVERIIKLQALGNDPVVVYRVKS